MGLQSGEGVIYEGHPSWQSILGFYLGGFAIARAVGAIVMLVQSTGTRILTAAVIAGVTLLAGLIKRVATTYTITDRRLNIKRGIVARKVQETRLQRVQT